MTEHGQKTRQVGNYLVRGHATEINDGAQSKLTGKWQAQCEIMNSANQQKQWFGNIRFYADTFDEAATHGLNYGADLVNSATDDLKI